MKYAPIGITVYTRVDHLRRAVDHLRSNPIAEKSDLYFFSDGPKPGDEDKVADLRKFLKSVDGFHSVTIIERETNSRVRNNREGHKDLLQRYGRMIWLAEDVLCAPGFLTFVNNALELYRDVERVNSVSAYVEPFQKPMLYTYDAFFTHRFNGWGFGIWADRYDQLPAHIEKDDYLKLINDKNTLKKFKYYIGEDALDMVRRDAEGEIDALDVRIMFYQFLKDKVTVRPIRSLTANIGHDGSGTHCNVTNKFDVKMWDKTGGFRFPRRIKIKRRFAKPLSEFRRVSAVQSK